MDTATAMILSMIHSLESIPQSLIMGHLVRVGLLCGAGLAARALCSHHTSSIKEDMHCHSKDLARNKVKILSQDRIDVIINRRVSEVVGNESLVHGREFSFLLE